MPTILFYFDFASPQAYVAFHRLPQVLGGLAWQVRHRPVSRLAVLGDSAREQRGSVATHAMLAWEQRHAQWLAAQYQLPFKQPVNTAFAPDNWLCMAQASSPHGLPGRQVCETLFNAIWQQGHDPDDPAVQQQAWQDAAALLPAARDWREPAIAHELREIARAALAHQVFTVPAFVLLPEAGAAEAVQTFYGVEGLPMLRAAVQARLPDMAGDDSEQP